MLMSHLQAQVAEKMLENLELRKAMHTAKAASEPTILQVSLMSVGLAASRKAADWLTVWACNGAVFQQGQVHQ